MRAWTVEDIRRLTQPHSDLSDQDRPLTLSNEDFRQIGETLEAFWQNEDEPGSFPYHAIMVSGLHTNGFVNVSTVLAETLTNPFVRSEEHTSELQSPDHL